MQDQLFSEDFINSMILKYSEETFTVRDAVKFEMLLKYNPEYSKIARANRNIRVLLRSLPRVSAKSGFEGRLADRVHLES